jgi:pimeloyl-ACP methyl ester carboxylesterase
MLVAAAILIIVMGGLALVTLLASRRAERLAPPLGQFCAVPGGRIHYTDQGSGAAIVLIHGLGGNLRNFAPALVDRLARSHRLIALDRPGSGYSTANGPVPDLHGQAAMVISLLETLQPGPVTLVGHSLGGALSLALVEARPDLVASLALVAPLTQPISQAPSEFRILMIRSAVVRRIFAWLVIGPVGVLAGRARQSPVFAPDPVPASFAGQGGGALLFRPDTFDAASRDAQAVPDTLPAIAAGYPGIARPVDVLFAKGDQILAPALHGAAFVTQIPGARCHIAEGGHMLPFTHPEATAQWVEQVLASRL